MFNFGKGYRRVVEEKAWLGVVWGLREVKVEWLLGILSLLQGCVRDIILRGRSLSKCREFKGRGCLEFFKGRKR